jgi:GDP-L-fucose synthase
MLKKKIFIAGHRGMVGSAILNNFRSAGFDNIVTRGREYLDLTVQPEVEKFFKDEKPEAVIIAAAKVGGILANNTFRADFIYKNLMIEANIIQAAYRYGTEKLIFLGSSCIYPKFAKQPIKEEELLEGKLEYTNEPYAIAKIAGIKLCESYYRQYGSNFISVMPCNLYGPNDNFDLNSSHVLPALIRKFHEARNEGNKVTIWGTGKPEREFLYVEDLAEAVRFVMGNVDAEQLYQEGISHLNIGSGTDVTINELQKIIAQITGFTGEVVFDPSKPDGTPKKLLDVSRINNLGWKAATDLKSGIKKTYDWYLQNIVRGKN